MRFFTLFPLMIIPVVVYNIFALGGATYSTIENMRLRLDTDVFAIPMTSGATVAYHAGTCADWRFFITAVF